MIQVNFGGNSFEIFRICLKLTQLRVIPNGRQVADFIFLPLIHLIPALAISPPSPHSDTYVQAGSWYLASSSFTRNEYFIDAQCQFIAIIYVLMPNFCKLFRVKIKLSV